VAINALVQACAQLTQNRLAETMYRRAVNNEIERFRLGKSTILDVMDAQDRLNGALSSVVAAQATVAKSIVDLRYQSGLLIDAEGDGSQRLPLEHLVTLPDEVFQPEPEGR
jgi:outer membrane protein TolC